MARTILRSSARAALGALIARPLLREVIGRWPTPAEVGLFRAAFAQPHSAVPPIVRAMASVPAARPQLSRAMLVSWMTADASYRGELVRGLDSHAARGPGDVLSVWHGPPVAFLHLEKTAGMSVLDVLERQFHPTQINPDIVDPEPDQAMRRYALIRGHFDLPTLRRIDPDRFVMTFLREPRARILSLYQYWRSYKPALSAAFPPEVGKASAMPLLDWLRDGSPEVRNAIDNHYVRKLLGAYDGRGPADPLRGEPDACLDRAREKLDAMGFVGVTEAMERSLSLLTDHLGVDRPVRAPRVNVTAENPTGPSAAFRRIEPAPITPEVEAELDRLTRLDRVLYERARGRLAALADA